MKRYSFTHLTHLSRLRHVHVAALAALALVLACGGEEEAPESTGEVATAEVETEATEAAEPEAEEYPGEVCARAIVVAWQGADYAADDVTRSQQEARTRAEELRNRVLGGEDFAAVAREASDASSSGPRGGMLGTYARSDWPSAHEAIADPTYALAVGDTSEVLEAGYGYVITRRCPVEKVDSRHILIRYVGAQNAPEDTVRSKPDAEALARSIRESLEVPEADFEQIARVRSEDASAERGGNLGPVGRGLLAPEYEAAAFALQPGEVSDVVESAFGFHIIQRVE